MPETRVVLVEECQMLSPYPRTFFGAKNSQASESCVAVAVTNSPALTFFGGLKVKECISEHRWTH